MQDYASNSSHSSLRRSARTSIGEEYPVNPVVSISLTFLANLSCIRMLLYVCIDVNVQVYSSAVISCAVEVTKQFK